MRFLSHRDMMVLWELALRRAALPLRLGEGFNPRPRLSLPLPRNVGVSSESEILEFELRDWVNPDTVIEGLRRQVPAGIELARIEILGASERARPVAVTYEVQLSEAADNIDRRIEEFLDAGEVFVRRPQGASARRRIGAQSTDTSADAKRDDFKKPEKIVNIRQYVLDVSMADGRLWLHLAITPTGAARPDEVLSALGLEADRISRARIHRTKIELASQGKNHVKRNAYKRH